MRRTVAGRAPATLQNVSPRRLFLTAGRVGGSHARTARKTARKTSAPAASKIRNGRKRRRRRNRIAPRIQKRSAAANASTIGLDFPKRIGAVVSSATAKVGTRSAGFRLRKSKISCPPGSSPVVKVAQETGVCAGTVGVSGE